MYQIITDGFERKRDGANILCRQMKMKCAPGHDNKLLRFSMVVRALLFGGAMVMAWSAQAQWVTQSTPNGEGNFALKGNLPVVAVAPMPGGYDAFVLAALRSKHAPVVLTTNPANAKYILAGNGETTKANWAKTVFTNELFGVGWLPLPGFANTKSEEQLAINLAEIDSGKVVWTCSAYKASAYRARRSAAETCAKELKQYLEGL